MSTIKHYVSILRTVAADLEKLTSDGSLESDGVECALAYDRIADAHRDVSRSADFFDGLLVGLIAGGVIKDKDE